MKFLRISLVILIQHFIVITVIQVLVVKEGQGESTVQLTRRRCGYDSFTFLKSGNITCVKCKECPPGFGLDLECGRVYSYRSIISVTLRNKCRPCPEGSFAPSFSRGFCHKCSMCGPGRLTVQNCTSTRNTVCGACKTGYYLNTILHLCLPCSHSNKLLSYRCSRSTVMPLVTKIQTLTRSAVNLGKRAWSIPAKAKVNQKSLKKTKENIPYISLIVVCLVVILVMFATTAVVFAKRNLKNRSKLKRNSTPHKSQGDQSDALEDWSNNDVTNCVYSFLKSAVTIKYDQSSIKDKYKSLVVETLSERNGKYSKALKSNQVFLSPIFKFYSQGEKFEKLVKISLPHSALWKAENKTWDIEIIYIDERKEKEGKWKKVEGDIEISCKDVSFYSDTLLTYAVVGRPLAGAKKRMQFVMFAMDEMMSDRFEVNIHLLDDNESSWQRVVKENKSKGFSMLGSFYAAFVDCFSQTDISINVQGLLDGWELDCLDPETISSSDCANTSYVTIPSFKAVFRRTKRYAEKFTCKFILDVSGSEIIIPALTFLPKEELCVKVDIHEEDCSPIKQNTTRFMDLPYDVLYVVSRMLDVSVKGQGTWREIGRRFGLGDDVEQFSMEYATLEGSPSRALFEYLHATKPDITVGEFAQCLESLGREDVMWVLYKHRKKIYMN